MPISIYIYLFRDKTLRKVNSHRNRMQLPLYTLLRFYFRSTGTQHLACWLGNKFPIFSMSKLVQKRYISFMTIPEVCCLMYWSECVCANLSESTNTGLWIMMNLLLPTSIFFWEKVNVPRPWIVTPLGEEGEGEREEEDGRREEE